MTSATAPRSLVDRHAEVETPEHVALQYELADLGSRFAALLVDNLAILAGLAMLWGGLDLAVDYALAPPEWFRELRTAVLTLLTFVWWWGYFVLYEGLRDGQTPGKRLMRIRVVHDGGYALTVRGAAIRNLVRVVDVQPTVSCLVGGGVMMFHPQAKRLGDLAAGTVVVRERQGTALPEESAGTEAAGPPRLSDAEFELLGRFLARRGDLAAEIRATTARRLWDRMAGRFDDDPRLRHHSPDDFLALIYADEAGRRRAAGVAGRAGTAQASLLVRRQGGRWDEYRALLERARTGGLARLPARDLSRFGALYREVSADLARARTYGGSAELVYTLERAVGAGHNLLYRPAERSWRLLRAWLTRGFPALVRRRWRAIALAAVCLYLPALVTFAALRADPTRARDVVPAVLMARAEEAQAKEARGEGYVEVPQISMPTLASGLISNNVGVTFTAFAGGILAGLGTFAILVFNGVHLGSAAAVFANLGVSLHLWTFVLPHGVVELTAICIAGGAGFLLGSAILLPGRLTRRQALVERGSEAISLIAGTTMLLVIAGVIEGFVSPSELPRAAKMTFAAVVAVLLVLYLAFAGRERETAA